MQVLFGAEHDFRHIDPDQPDGYEWWYFDALSDNGRWALVVIYFLGSPMSPYYRAVVDGRHPIPRDWCGVFVSLHELTGGHWRERAYAYNLRQDGDFSAEQPGLAIGASRMSRSIIADGHSEWRLSLDEPGLWRGRTCADLRFIAVSPIAPFPATGHTENMHTWVCVAPDCRVEGHFETPSGARIEFSGSGYHDHNYGELPWERVETWYWGRAHMKDAAGRRLSAVLYCLESTDSIRETILVLLDANGRIVGREDARSGILTGMGRGRYGLDHFDIGTAKVIGMGEWAGREFRIVSGWPGKKGAFSDGPFYRRLPFFMSLEEPCASGDMAWRASGQGIGEIFRPARLCGPIASRAMWSRIRRRRD